MAVFGEEYVKLKGYLQEGYFVQLRGLVQERFRQVGNWGFELRSVQLLSDLREKMAKSFTINIPLPKLNDAFLEGIKDILAQNEIEGVVPNCQLKFKIWDPQDEISVEMPAKSLKINLTNEFLDCIDKFEGINYRLN
jgi:DNA polymerase-3 subunit alpha